MSNFFFLHNFVSFLRRNMCDTSMERCALGLHFFFLHLRALSNLWERYDLKSKKKWQVCVWLACNRLISSHRINCNMSIERSHQYLHFSFLHQQALNYLRGRYDAKTEENADIFLATVSFLHTESSVIGLPLLTALIETFLCFHYTDSSEQLMRTL